MPKRVLDEYDLEAEREGFALRHAYKSAKPVGKHTARTRRELDGTRTSINTRITKRYLKG